MRDPMVVLRAARTWGGGSLAGAGAAQEAADAAHRPVYLGAERVVLHQVGPGGRGPLQAGGAEVGAVGGDGHALEGLGGPLRGLVEQGVEAAHGRLVELVERVEAAA